MALKIIRNKKRFQKQAAVEAAILALLREQVVLQSSCSVILPTGCGLHAWAGCTLGKLPRAAILATSSSASH